MKWRYLERHLLDLMGEGLYVEGILVIKIENKKKPFNAIAE
jgi:hypothetical protein